MPLVPKIGLATMSRGMVKGVKRWNQGKAGGSRGVGERTSVWSRKELLVKVEEGYVESKGFLVVVILVEGPD